MIEELYARLGVDPTATEAEIKAAYRRLARENHPDRNPGDPQAEAIFVGVGEAYRVLSDPASRTEYDQAKGYAPTPAADQAGVASLFGPRVRRARGGGWSPQLKERGEDLIYRLKLSLPEAVLGCTRTLDLPSEAPCEACRGTGAEPGSSPVLCGRCAGSGKVREQRGFFDAPVPCPDCDGSGRRVPTPCKLCGGARVQPRSRAVQVEVPRGVTAGTRLRLSGEGRPGPQRGPAGDLIVELSVTPHPLLTLDGVQLRCTLPVDLVTATLGGGVELWTLEGLVRLEVPAGSQPGDRLRLPGRGAFAADGQTRGDLEVTLQVELPTSLSPQAETLLRQLRALLPPPAAGSKIHRYQAHLARIKPQA